MIPEQVIQRIRAKVESQNVQLAQPLAESEVAAFEQENGVQLPQDYREFLLHIGNGGSGPPEYGLGGLGAVPSDFDSPLNLSKPFPFTQAWIWEDGETSTEGDQDDVYCGVLILGTEGCGESWALVVNGPDFGKIWNLGDVGIGPLNPPMTFLECYEAWLDGKRDWFEQ